MLSREKIVENRIFEAEQGSGEILTATALKKLVALPGIEPGFED